jgi:hypothetical protein
MTFIIRQPCPNIDSKKFERYFCEHPLKDIIAKSTYNNLTINHKVVVSELLKTDLKSLHCLWNTAPVLKYLLQKNQNKYCEHPLSKCIPKATYENLTINHEVVLPQLLKTDLKSTHCLHNEAAVLKYWS